MTTMAYHASFDLNDGVIDHVLQLYETPEVPHIVEPTISESSSSQKALSQILTLTYLRQAREPTSSP